MQDLIDVYRSLAAACDYALHLGLTEAGMGSKGVVATTAALAPLLQEGIGDTIRASLTPQPNGDRTEEVFVSQQILQSLGIRSFTPQVTACPGCGRTTSTFFQEMADQIQTYLREQMPKWKATHPGVETMKVAVMGCVVNGPGESKHSNIGISLPGTFEEPVAPVYVDGRLMTTLRGDRIVAEFIAILDQYVDRITLPPSPARVIAARRYNVEPAPEMIGLCSNALKRFFENLAYAGLKPQGGRTRGRNSAAGLLCGAWVESRLTKGGSSDPLYLSNRTTGSKTQSHGQSSAYPSSWFSAASVWCCLAFSIRSADRAAARRALQCRNGRKDVARSEQGPAYRIPARSRCGGCARRRRLAEPR